MTRCEGGPYIKPCPDRASVLVEIRGEPFTRELLCWRHAMPYLRVLVKAYPAAYVSELKEET